MFRLQKKSKDMVLINSWVLCGHWSRQILAEAEKHECLFEKSFGLTMRLPELSRLLFQSDLCSRFHYTSVDLATAVER